MPMAAGQRQKRLNVASIGGYSSREQHRTKRTNLGVVQNDLNMKSHISVEWDGNQKRVVAKQEQIGINWRQMRPFVNSVPNGHNVLADVFSIPLEIFDLDNLSEVLSYEAWETHLSENERNLLMQFLPRDLDPHQVVQELLDGDNFHFGSPFLKWGASICSGDLHPDIIVNQERHLKSEKRAYYSELHNYHNDMIEYLIKLKERWESYKDPEKEIVQKIWRPKDDVEKRMTSNVDVSKGCDYDENITATSESCSSGAEEKACSSNNQISSTKKGDKLQIRVLDKVSVKGKPRNLVIASDDMLSMGARPKKGDKLHKCNIHPFDGDKYMSCIKISKKQHELVKSMKQSGKSIQSKSLNRVLGNLDSIHVQSYEVFIKEEQNKLHDHWLKLVNKDLPVAHVNWTERWSQRHAVMTSLVLEMKSKLKLLSEDEDNVSLACIVQDEDDDRGLNDQSSLEDDKDNVNLGSKLQDQKGDGGLNDQSNSEDDGDFNATSPENQPPHNAYIGTDGEFNPISMDSEKNLVSSESDDVSMDKTEYSRNMNSPNVSTSEGAPFTSGGDDVWQVVEMPHSYYDSAVPHEYTTSQLSLANQQINGGQQTRLTVVESDLHRQDTSKELFHRQETSKELLHRQSDDGSFNSYANQDRSGLLQSLFKEEGMLPYHHGQKGAGLDFQSSNNVMMGSGRFPGHFKEPLQPSLALDQGQRGPSQVYLSENMSGSMYSDGARYLIPRQDPLSAANMTDWAVNAARMSVPSQSHPSTGEFVSQPWFPAENQVRGAWNISEGSSLSSQNLGNGGDCDQSLFSVVSHLNQVPAANPYHSVRHPDQLLTSRTYRGVDASSRRINAVVPQDPHQLNYLSGCEAPNSLMPDDMSWMSLPHQNPPLHDQMGKPCLRSWNR